MGIKTKIKNLKNFKMSDLKGNYPARVKKMLPKLNITKSRGK